MSAQSSVDNNDLTVEAARSAVNGQRDFPAGGQLISLLADT
jgi:hypothetical protein